jgi:hypothetical protein
MSDTAWNRRKTGWEGAVTRRKPDFLTHNMRLDGASPMSAKAHISIMQADYDLAIRAASPRYMMEKEYPRSTVVAFAGGVTLFVIGLIILLYTAMRPSDVVRLISSVIMAIGSITVVLALLRGQDIDALSK